MRLFGCLVNGGWMVSRMGTNRSEGSLGKEVTLFSTKGQDEYLKSNLLSLLLNNHKLVGLKLGSCTKLHLRPTFLWRECANAAVLGWPRWNVLPDISRAWRLSSFWKQDPFSLSQGEHRNNEALLLLTDRHNQSGLKEQTWTKQTSHFRKESYCEVQNSTEAARSQISVDECMSKCTQR